ncbi:MAG TPA: hypothetical protein VHA82_10955 [Ramlibacter sp.]|uniref:hypothetical protein n=1 Tax=Ramlibacter sp. TaxID=1917967 RepID=UPI002B7EDD52|nr:hypothetical protein [Ramlibacter sp.]HVZ44318.1 hypothetical protein [Ramlibacter sp.]
MQTVTASPISEIDAVQITDDGLYMLLHCKDGNGRPIVLAFPEDQLKVMIACCASARRSSNRMLKSEPLKGVFDTDGCEIDLPADAKDALLTLTIEGGGHLRFFMDDALLKPLYETLRGRFEAS